MSPARNLGPPRARFCQKLGTTPRRGSQRAFLVGMDVLGGDEPAERHITRSLQQVGSSLGIAIKGSLLNSAYRAEELFDWVAGS